MEVHNNHLTGKGGRMQLKTILNRVLKIKSFVYGTVRWVEGEEEPTIEIEVRGRENSRPECSGCGRRGPGYDRLPERRFEFIPFWGIKVFFLYAPRRVQCPRCGVKVEQMPWAAGKHHLTDAYAWFLAGWAKRLSWKEVAEAFHTTWDHVFHSVQMAVLWGRKHMEMSNINAIGIDEIQWQRGHKYLTLVYQIDAHCKRLLWIGKKRKVKTLLGFFRWFGKERSESLRFICSDMWKPYLKVIAKKAGKAIHVLDRFHIMAHMSKAIDEVRATEARELKAKGYEPVLTKTRWLLLKRPESLSKKQEVKLTDLLRYSLRKNIVAPAQRSPKAKRKAASRRTEQDDLPVHSFQMLLADLATITKNRIQPLIPGSPTFDKLTTPSHVQQKALDLLGVRL